MVNVSTITTREFSFQVLKKRLPIRQALFYRHHPPLTLASIAEEGISLANLHLFDFIATMATRLAKATVYLKLLGEVSWFSIRLREIFQRRSALRYGLFKH